MYMYIGKFIRCVYVFVNMFCVYILFFERLLFFFIDFLLNCVLV